MSTDKTLTKIISDSEAALKPKVKWMNKQYKNKKTQQMCDLWICYLEANVIQDYLDETVGPENWQAEYYQVKETLFCKIGIFWENTWIWKSNAGSESNIEKEKGEATDAFKRAAFAWGFGRFLYDDKRKPVKGKQNFAEKTEKKDPEEDAKILVCNQIMEYGAKLPTELEEALNYVSEKGHASLSDCPLTLLSTIQKRLGELEKEKEKELTAGFSATPTE